MSNLSTALAGSLPTEVEFRATVTSPPRFFTGTLSNTRHEAFDVRSDDGLAVEVVDNVDLAPQLPVGPGDQIVVRGELVDSPQRGPLVHWTHHDPAGVHPDGWIDLRGRRYA